MELKLISIGNVRKISFSFLVLVCSGRGSLRRCVGSCRSAASCKEPVQCTKQADRPECAERGRMPEFTKWANMKPGTSRILACYWYCDARLLNRAGLARLPALSANSVDVLAALDTNR
mgnify:CR=1 FL=1